LNISWWNNLATIIQVKVTPNASRNQILGWEGEVLKVRIKGVPEKGRVNEELIEFLADEWDIPKSRIAILSGHTSRLKRLKIEGEVPHLSPLRQR
jgi:uncharacterized protein (TIGR00251 family)